MTTKTCSKCSADMEELGTAGFMQDNEYHNRHDWRCKSCGNRDDENDCNCDRTCKANFEHHQKHSKLPIKDGRKK